MFDGFRRLAGVKGGLNLALPLAKRIVELHGGAVELSDGARRGPACASAPSFPSASAAKKRPRPAACPRIP